MTCISVVDRTITSLMVLYINLVKLFHSLLVAYCFVIPKMLFLCMKVIFFSVTDNSQQNIFFLSECVVVFQILLVNVDNGLTENLLALCFFRLLSLIRRLLP